MFAYSPFAFRVGAGRKRRRSLFCFLPLPSLITFLFPLPTLNRFIWIMNGMSLSKQDKWLMGLSVLVPPVAIYMKFGRSYTLWISCLCTLCLFLPGIIHAIILIRSYPSVVFRGIEEPKDKNRVSTTQEGNVIWEIPKDHFRSISESVRVVEAQQQGSAGAVRGHQSVQVVRDMSAVTTVTSGSRSMTTVTNNSPEQSSKSLSFPYAAHIHGQEPFLNPSYGWEAMMTQQPPQPTVRIVK